MVMVAPSSGLWTAAGELLHAVWLLAFTARTATMLDVKVSVVGETDMPASPPDTLAILTVTFAVGAAKSLTL